MPTPMPRPLRLLALLAFAAGVAVTGCKKDLVCPADQLACDGTCVAVQTDPNHCGSCDVACGAGRSCSGGQCYCPDGRGECGGACVDLKSDPGHCGSCPVACGAGQVCTTPTGGAPSCAAACAEDTQTSCSGACVSLATDPWNCGACGRACGTRERCVEARCTADLYLACYNTSDVREATATLEPAGVPLPVHPGAIALAFVDGELFEISAGRGGAETLTRIDRGPPAVQGVDLWHSGNTPDIEYMTSHRGSLYVSHNSLGTLLVLSPTGEVVEEHAFAEGTNLNPQGFAFSPDGDLAYVALEAANAVAVLDVSTVGRCDTPHACIREVARVDVSSLASPTAHAMPARVAVSGDRAYVVLWNLDDNWAAPAGSHGRLAVIDRTTSTLDATVGGETPGLLDLGAGCLNPADADVNGTTLYVTCGAFDYSTSPVSIRGTGIVPVDLSGATPAVGAPLAAPADAAPGTLAFCKGSGYVADRNSGRVFRLDPTAGAVDGAELCPPKNGYAYVADIVCGE